MKIRIASTKAIKYACLKFHYARAVPLAQYAFNIFNKQNEWCGVIIYGFGANKHIARPFNLYQGEVIELVRVALNGKQETTSRAIALTLRELKKIAPQVKIIVSYADLDQNHAGIIYQATNWIYLGKHNEHTTSAFIVRGKKVHPKSLYSKGYKQSIEWIQKHIDKNARKFVTKGKHKYIFCLCKKQRKKWEKHKKEYPKKEDCNGK